MNTKQLAKFVIDNLEDNKAKDVKSIDLKGKSDIADFMVVATGTSGRHVNSLAENLVQDLRAEGVKSIDPEGTETGEWVLIDLFDIIVHIMQEDARGKYDLESMWQVPVEKKRAAAKEKKEKEPRAEKATKKVAAVKKATAPKRAKKTAAK